MSAPTTVKVVLLGDSGVGKTSIVTRYTTGIVQLSVKPTVGAAFVTKELSVEGQDFELLIWDTAGQEVYRGLAPMYYRSAGIAIIVFDVVRPQTYQSVSYWIKELKANVDKNTVLVVCANKVDKDEPRVPDAEVAQKFAQENGALYVETSAISGIGIDRLFQAAVQQYIKVCPVNQENPAGHKNTVTIDNDKTEKKGSSCC